MRDEEKFSIQHEKRIRALAANNRNIRLLLEEIDRLRDNLARPRKWLDQARKQAAGTLVERRA
jgi:hypothetical protein